jgi:hypothetical protein
VPAQASRQMLVNTRSWLHCTPEAQGKATKQTMYNYVLQKSLEKISRQFFYWDKKGKDIKW